MVARLDLASIPMRLATSRSGQAPQWLYSWSIIQPTRLCYWEDGSQKPSWFILDLKLLNGQKCFQWTWYPLTTTLSCALYKNNMEQKQKEQKYEGFTTTYQKVCCKWWMVAICISTVTKHKTLWYRLGMGEWSVVILTSANFSKTFKFININSISIVWMATGKHIRERSIFPSVTFYRGLLLSIELILTDKYRYRIARKYCTQTWKQIPLRFMSKSMTVHRHRASRDLVLKWIHTK